MRVVAIALTCLLLAIPAIALPGDGSKVGTYDSCANAVGTAATNCLRLTLTVGSASPPSQATNVVGQHLYLWLGAAECRSTACSELPPNQSTTIYGTPTRVGIIFGDTNGIPGLQRNPVVQGGTTFPADHSILV